MQDERDVARSYDHGAFRVAAEDLEAYRQAIESLGLDVRERRSSVEGEGESLYFHDEDGHLFELGARASRQWVPGSLDNLLELARRCRGPVRSR